MERLIKHYENQFEVLISYEDLNMDNKPIAAGSVHHVCMCVCFCQAMIYFVYVPRSIWCCVPCHSVKR